MTYAEKLKDPRWQKKRLLVLKHADFRCQLCGNARETLHVHHSRYLKGKQPWEYPTGALIAVCETHHIALHVLLRGGTKRSEVVHTESVESANENAPISSPFVKSRFQQMRDMCKGIAR